MSDEQQQADDGTGGGEGYVRASPRDSMFLIAQLRRAGGAWVPIKVRNLSTGGMMAESPTSFSRDEQVEAEMRGLGEVTGRIAWSAGGRIGVQFDREVDPKLARKPVSGGPQPQLVKVARTVWRPGVRAG